MQELENVMSLQKNVARTWSMSLVLLMVPLAWADKKSSPSPKPAAAPKAATAAHGPANTNARTAPSQHPTTTNSGAKFGRGAASHPVTGTHAGAAGAGHSGATRSRTLANGTTVRVGPGGRIRSIHTANGLTINRSVGGQRTIITRRNGRTLVSTGPNSGYMQRHYMNRNGRVYVQRTYVVGGRTSVYVYNRYSYRGVFYYGYVPGYYYRPAFYGWLYNPWLTPIHYRWDWWGSAWYAPYGYYFAPAPAYPVASLWLTDYLLAESLRAGYDAGLASNATAGSGGPPAGQSAQGPVLTPEIKQAIADEVRRQIDAERAAAANPQQPAAASQQQPAAVSPQQPAGTSSQPAAATLVAEQRPAALDPAVSIFVVSSSIDVNAGDQACSLSAGDVITRVADTPDAQQNISVKVTSSKRSDCPAGQQVALAVQDLQEMNNQFRAKIDSGLQMLAQNQGKNGLPAAPDTQVSAGEVPAPAPDAVRVELQKVQAEADQTETDTKKQVAGQA
jgi:hypothetical protein